LTLYLSKLGHVWYCSLVDKTIDCTMHIQYHLFQHFLPRTIVLVLWCTQFISAYNTV